MGSEAAALAALALLGSVPCFAREIAKPFETLTLPADGTRITTRGALAAGRKYRLRVIGTYRAGDSWWGDAAYHFDSWEKRIERTCPKGERLGVKAEGMDLRWGRYTSKHVYETSISGAGAPLAIRLEDCPGADNWGKLTVEVYR